MELTDRELALRWWNRKSIQEKTELAKQAKFPVENRDFKTFCGLAKAAKRWFVCRAACTKPLLYAGTDYLVKTLN